MTSNVKSFAYGTSSMIIAAFAMKRAYDRYTTTDKSKTIGEKFFSAFDVKTWMLIGLSAFCGMKSYASYKWMPLNDESDQAILKRIKDGCTDMRGGLAPEWEGIRAGEPAPLQTIITDIWHTLGKGERLTKAQEELMMKNIKAGDSQYVAAIVQQLRQNSSHLQEKAVDELAKVVTNCCTAHIVQADIHLQGAVKSEFRGAFTLAQANRLENTLIQRRAQAPMTTDAARTFAASQRIEAIKIAQTPIQQHNNPQVPNAARQAQMRAAAEHQRAIQATQNVARPAPRPPVVGQGSIDGVRTAVRASTRVEPYRGPLSSFPVRH